ncbi:hypothetical protein [Priestia megaterium]|uniref:hypothetical protein n=1 Tax=Priestia megaterium TaxID=1404 RepID=UPI002363B1A0|nr:hypothetical protein [Priestia megaterium]MDD1515781.1 hypothetical protein [Priestia megaterium]
MIFTEILIKIVSYLANSAVNGIFAGLFLLLLQTISKQGIAYQFTKKSQKLKYEYDQKLKNFNHKYDEKLKDLNYEYDKKLVYFNEQIAIQADYRKLDFDRRIHDFSIYSSKRYEAYSEFFKQLYKLQSDFWVIRIFNGVLSNFYSLEEIEKFLRKNTLAFPEQLVDEARELFERYERANENVNVSEKDCDELRKSILSLIGHKAELLFIEDLRPKIIDTLDYFGGNFLYFSDELGEKARDLLKFMIEFADAEIEFDEKAEMFFRESFNEVKDMLKKELSRGDYPSN